MPLYVCRGAAILHVSEVCTPVKSSGATPEFSVFKLYQKAFKLSEQME